MTLTEFLLARIAEDEHLARATGYGDFVALDDLGFRADDAVAAARAQVGDPAWRIAECEAKRRIVELAESATEMHYEWEKVEALLALPYAAHPDYDESWRP